MIEALDDITLLNPSQFESPLNVNTFSLFVHCPQKTCPNKRLQVRLDISKERKLGLNLGHQQKKAR